MMSNKLSFHHHNWIRNESLVEVFTKLIELHSIKPEEIDGITLGLIAKRLIKAEEKVGGPYYEKGSDKIELNMLIDTFFTKLGSPLENVRLYLEETTNYKLSIKNSATLKSLDNPIAMVVRKELSVNHPMSLITLKIWDAISSFDKKWEVTHLAKYFADSLVFKVKIPDSKLVTLGAANFYAWMAYSIYDDIIDGENKSGLLPIANILNRRALAKYLSVSDYQYIQKSFDEVDEGNLKEINTYRFEVSGDRIKVSNIRDYMDDYFIASCAIGHTLGPSILIEKYLKATARQKKAINDGFRYYLIARQLNDDAHDWIEDLKNGQGSLVLFYLFSRIGLEPGEHSVNELVKRLKSYFWKFGVDEISNLTIDKVAEAKRCFINSGLLLENNIFFENILNPIADAAKSSSRVLKNQKEFLKVYSS